MIFKSKQIFNGNLNKNNILQRFVSENLSTGENL
jgi:hypothetical protein